MTDMVFFLSQPTKIPNPTESGSVKTLL